MSCVSRMAALAIPAVRQILARLAKGDKEEEEFVEKIENSCLKFDHDKKGMLTPDEYFNVMKLQNGVDCTKEEVISANYINKIPKPLEVRTICGPLPCNKKGEIKIRDFLYLDIHRQCLDIPFCNFLEYVLIFGSDDCNILNNDFV